MGKRVDVAIVGVGVTEQGEIPDETSDEIAVRAALAALEDAGLEKGAIDGLITCRSPRSVGREGTDEEVGRLLGVNPAFASTLEYGACGFSLHLGAMAIESGLASTVLLTYGTNQRTARKSFGVPVGGDAFWAAEAGLVHVAGPAAMAARLHMHRYGTTEEQLGWIAVSQREWAQQNPLAIFRAPMGIDDYLSAPYVVEPLRRPDLTMISDGGAAVVMVSAGRARRAHEKPVFVHSIAQRSSLQRHQPAERLMRPWLADLALDLYRSGGITPEDVDAAYLQDATSVWVLQMLESFGFCSEGEAGPFVADGNIRPGGSLPVNTNGGQLSEAYMWNWLHLYEAVRQLRGDCGDRQLPNIEIALHAQTHDFFKGAATLLSTSGPET